MNLGYYLHSFTLQKEKKSRKEETLNFLFKNIFSHLLLHKARNNFTPNTTNLKSIYIQRRYLLDLLLQFPEMINILEIDRSLTTLYKIQCFIVARERVRVRNRVDDKIKDLSIVSPRNP